MVGEVVEKENPTASPEIKQGFKQAVLIMTKSGAFLGKTTNCWILLTLWFRALQLEAGAAGSNHYAQRKHPQNKGPQLCRATTNHEGKESARDYAKRSWAHFWQFMQAVDKALFAEGTPARDAIEQAAEVVVPTWDQLFEYILKK